MKRTFEHVQQKTKRVHVHTNTGQPQWGYFHMDTCARTQNQKYCFSDTTLNFDHFGALVVPVFLWLQVEYTHLSRVRFGHPTRSTWRICNFLPQISHCQISHNITTHNPNKGLDETGRGGPWFQWTNSSDFSSHIFSLFKPFFADLAFDREIHGTTCEALRFPDLQTVGNTRSSRELVNTKFICTKLRMRASTLFARLGTPQCAHTMQLNCIARLSRFLPKRTRDWQQMTQQS